jgi:hypothetical protein
MSLLKSFNHLIEPAADYALIFYSMLFLLDAVTSLVLVSNIPALCS